MTDSLLTSHRGANTGTAEPLTPESSAWQPGFDRLPTSRERMLKALRCQPVDRPPVWLMRQAGRCLPEYRALKEKFSFRELIRNPELAAEVTLQPIRRFGFDAAILFSDILVIPEAMGQGFRFRDQGGVEMSGAISNFEDIKKLSPEGVAGRLQYVADALQLIKADLGQQTALLGFAGSPWTLANFMLEGGSSHDFIKARALFNHDRQAYDLLAEKLTAAVVEFLKLQIANGADAIQIFDSVGGLLPADEFEAASGQWMERIIDELGGRVPVIVYSKGTRSWTALLKTRAQVIGVDQGIAMAEAMKKIPAGVGIQGNLDPALLSDAEPRAVEWAASWLLNELRGRAGHIFNLGHGVPPNARLENLEALVNTVRNFV